MAETLYAHDILLGNVDPKDGDIVFSLNPNERNHLVYWKGEYYGFNDEYIMPGVICSASMSVHHWDNNNECDEMYFTFDLDSIGFPDDIIVGENIWDFGGKKYCFIYDGNYMSRDDPVFESKGIRDGFYMVFGNW